MNDLDTGKEIKLTFKAYRHNVKASGYSESGASHTKRALKSMIPNSMSAVEDIDENNSTLRERSRMLFQGAPIATAAINTNRTKIIGTGLTMKSTVNAAILGISEQTAKAWQEKTEAEFALWAEKKQCCDALGLNTFKELQQLVVRSWLLSGDVFGVIKQEPVTNLSPYGLRVHIVEADRVRTPLKYGGTNWSCGTTEGKIPEGEPGAGHKIHDGVEVDEQGKVVAYHVCSVYPRGRDLSQAKWTRIPAVGAKTGRVNILHIMDAERPDQYRGVPYLSACIEPLLQLRRYTESELNAALVQSFFTAWVNTSSDVTANPFGEVGAGDVAGIETGDLTEDGVSTSENEYEMGPGTVLHLAEGENVTFGNPNIPTAGFATFEKAIISQVGAALEIPYDILMKQYEASYSASRGALLEAWEAFKMRRVWVVNDFCQPVYELWLEEAVARGRIKAPGFFDDPLIRAAWCKATWIGPVQGSLDPGKEISADLDAVANGIKTLSKCAAERGEDFTANIQQAAVEQEALKAIFGHVTGQETAATNTEPEEDKKQKEGEQNADE